MRWGVLDIGSNTGHLAVFEVGPGTKLTKRHKHSELLALGDHVDAHGAVTADGVDILLEYVRRMDQLVADEGWTIVDAVATATIRDATNRDEVIAAVNAAVRTFTLRVLDEADEAHLSYLAARRCPGQEASGRVAVVDIGGGSLEITVGSDGVPAQWMSRPLGARRLTRDVLDRGGTLDDVRARVRSEVGPLVPVLTGAGLDAAIGTSWTMRRLGKICGNPVRRDVLGEQIERLAPRTREDVRTLLQIEQKRADQVLAGATVAEAVMDLFSLEQLQICRWALREGVILRHLDRL